MDHGQALRVGSMKLSLTFHEYQMWFSGPVEKEKGPRPLGRLDHGSSTWNLRLLREVPATILLTFAAVWLVFLSIVVF